MPLILQTVLILAGRVLLAGVFLFEGWAKLTAYAAAGAYMQAFGVPSQLLPAVIAAELGGGLLVLVGWRTREAALALGAFCIAAAALFHANVADRNQWLHFEKDLAIAGGFLVLAAAGGGRFSVDAWRAPSGPSRIG